MSFDWSHFLGVATELAKCPPDEFTEARERAAVSRAYYALFGATCQRMQELGEFHPHRHGIDHERIREELDSRRERTRNKISEILKRLVRSRTMADYRSDVHALGTSTVLAQARQGLALLASIEK